MNPLAPLALTLQALSRDFCVFGDFNFFTSLGPFYSSGYVKAVFFPFTYWVLGKGSANTYEIQQIQFTHALTHSRTHALTHSLETYLNP